MSLLLRLTCRLLGAAPRPGPRPPALSPPGRPVCGLPRRAPPAPILLGLLGLPARELPRRAPRAPAAPPAPALLGLLGLPARELPRRAPPAPLDLPGRPAPRAPAPAPARPPAPPLLCRNVLKIRRRKMNHHKYRKLVKRTRFLRRKVREGRLRRKQAKFEGDLRRIWLRAGLKDAPAGWQTPRIYLKGK